MFYARSSLTRTLTRIQLYSTAAPPPAQPQKQRRHVKWIWELLPGWRDKAQPMTDRRRQLAVDAYNPGAMVKDIRDFRDTSGKYSIASSDLIPASVPLFLFIY
jgi:hypothetical protein